MIRHGSLCTGLGGFELAASWSGWENIFHCEIDSFCRKVLQHHFPKSKSYGDIRKFKATKYAGKIDVISAGFPCQPFSTAGQRNGKEDERFIWPEIIRIIKEAGPSWVVLENVPGILTVLEPEFDIDMEIKAPELFCQGAGGEQGNLSGTRGRTIGRIIEDLRAAGYSLPELKDGSPCILCIPASTVGAPHLRNRIFIVAHANCRDDLRGSPKNAPTDVEKGIPKWDELWELMESDRLRGYTDKNHATGQSCGRTEIGRIPDWKNFPTESAFRGGDDGVPEILYGISVQKWAKESLRAYGNAVVPQVVHDIFRIIDHIETNAH